jgi:hypothetical protein
MTSKPVFLGWKQIGRTLAPGLIQKAMHPFEMTDTERVGLQNLLTQMRGQTGEARRNLLEAAPEGSERSPAFIKLLGGVEEQGLQSVLSSVLPLLSQSGDKALGVLGPWVTGLQGQSSTATQTTGTESPFGTIFGSLLGGAAKLIPYLIGKP